MSHYDLHAYGQMLADEARISAYTAAIRAAVRPGDVVLELGTATGLMAMVACQCGARRVYALEPLDAIHVAQQAARDNGFSDRIVFMRARSTQIDLPEKCDVLISDLRGATPCFTSHLSDLMDARQRLLKPEARWICQTDSLFATVVEMPDPRDQIAHQWDGSRWGLDLRSALGLATNRFFRCRPDSQDVLAPARCWARIQYPTLTSPHVRGSTRLEVARDGTAQGIVIWFSAELFGGSTFTNEPGGPRGVYTPMFLPWERAIDLRAGDGVAVQFDVVFSGHEYWWNWTTTARRDGTGPPLAHFKQSSLKGQILNREIIADASGDSIPALTPSGEEARFILSRIDGHTTQAELASALRAQFPNRFPDDAAAVVRVSQVRRSVM